MKTFRTSAVSRRLKRRAEMSLPNWTVLESPDYVDYDATIQNLEATISKLSKFDDIQ